MNKYWRKHGLVRLLRNWSGRLGLILVVIYVTVALFAEVLAPFPPNQQHPEDRLQPPGPTYRLGTDEFGRDLLSRLIFGARNSLKVAMTFYRRHGYVQVGALPDYATPGVSELIFYKRKR